MTSVPNYADKLSVNFVAEYERLKKQSEHLKVGEFSVSMQSFYGENQNVKDMQDVLLQLKQHNTPYQYADLCFPLTPKMMDLLQLPEAETRLKKMSAEVDIGNFFTPSFIHVIRDEHGQLVGFYIFRVDRKQKMIDLVHFCLLNPFRKKGICTCFIDNFFVPLSCALKYDIVVDTEDLNLIDIWKKIGFTPYHMSITNKTYLRKFYSNGDGGNKQKGNDAFRNDRILDAVKYYTIAISRGENDDDRPHLLYSNRAYMYEKLGMPHHALYDALTSIRMCETFGKGYHRAAVAHLALGQVLKAYEAYQTAIKVDPDNTVQYEKYLSKMDHLKKTHDGILFMGYIEEIPQDERECMMRLVEKMVNTYHLKKDIQAMHEELAICYEQHGDANLKRLLETPWIVKFRQEFKAKKGGNLKKYL